MAGKNALDSKSTAADPSMAQEDSTVGNGKKRPYSPPRLLSSEPLELAAANCDPPTEPYGKAYIPPNTCYKPGS